MTVSCDDATDLLRLEVRRSGGRGVGSPSRQAISEATSLRLAIPRLTSDLRLANNNDDLVTGSKDVAQGSQTVTDVVNSVVSLVLSSTSHHNLQRHCRDRRR